jgi:pimeloyl-ACP methyl ester carboxylesterase
MAHPDAHRPGRALRRCAAAAVLALALAAVLSGPAAAHPPGRHGLNPVIFVHGGAGSGAQFESQQLRFTSNGYPQRLIRVLEYDSSFSLNTMEDVHDALDRLIASVEQETGRAQVDVLGHSLGTTVMHAYLNSSPARAAEVAHYVNIDGRTADSPPGAVPTLAIWAGRGAPGRAIGGATNVTVPNQTHVQSATSAESFVEMFRFFTGHTPRTSGIVPEAGRRLSVAGRAAIFPQNVGVQGATLQVWQVNGKTGQRERRHPLAVRAIGADGSWGPVHLLRGRHYEFALLRDGANTHHFYYEPFLRSDHLVRLLTSVPGTGVDALIERSERHTSVVVSRYKELWGDQGAQNDVLEIDGANTVNAATAPLAELVVAMFAFDRGSDGVTDLSAPLPAFIALPFLSGVDLFIPAAPGGGTVSVRLASRGGGPVRTVSFPSFPSSAHSVTVYLNDFECTHGRWVC